MLVSSYEGLTFQPVEGLRLGHRNGKFVPMSRKMVTIAICIIAILLLAWLVFGGRMNGHMWSGDHMSGSPMHQNTPIATGIVIPDLSANERKGERLFNENCAVCHGDNGAGNEGAGPPLVHKIYEPNHHGDMAFQLAAKNGVRAHHWPFGDMPPVSDVTENDVTDITAYVRALQRANGIN